MADAGQARVVLSIDLELVSRVGSWERQQRLERLTSELLCQLDYHQLPATLAVADPVHSAATEPILAHSPDHEIAILGDATWMGRGIERQRLARELERRLHRAISAGLDVSSLALRNVDPRDHWDLLAQQPIQAVRLSESRAAQPYEQHGLVVMPVSLHLPYSHPWWLPGAETMLRSLLRAAIGAGQVIHLTIDAGELVEASHARLGEIKAIFDGLAKLRDARQISVLTMREFAAQQSVDSVRVAA